MATYGLALPTMAEEALPKSSNPTSGGGIESPSYCPWLVLASTRFHFTLKNRKMWHFIPFWDVGHFTCYIIVLW